MNEIEMAIERLKIWIDCPVRFGGNCTEQIEQSCSHNKCWTGRRVVGSIDTAIQALQAQQDNGWVSVEKALPKNKSAIIDGETYYKNMYVQLNNGTLCIAFYDEKQGIWFMPLGLPLDSVLRWCDCLPLPPKGDVENEKR